MKKLLLSLLALVVMSVTSWAQTWTAPVYPLDGVAYVADGQTAYYIMNVSTGQFVTNGNAFGTQISTTADGIPLLEVVVESLSEQDEALYPGCVKIRTNGVYNDKNRTYLFRDTEDKGYIDHNNQACWYWKLEAVGNGNYYWHSAPGMGDYPNSATQYANAGSPGSAVDFTGSRSDSNIEWAFVRVDGGDFYRTRLSLYYLLNMAVKYNADYSSASTIYNNPNSTLSELQAAYTVLMALCNYGMFFEKNGSTATLVDGSAARGDITIPSSVVIDGETYPVTSIGEKAFYQNKSITSVVIPDGITTIGTSSFHSCDGLTQITLPNSLTSLGEGAFCDCDVLTSVRIPKNVTSIGVHAFSWSSMITSLTVDPANTVFNDGDGSNCIIETASSTLIAGCQTTVIPNGVKAIGISAFEGCNFSSIIIPGSVTSIGKLAFYGCQSLTSITISEGVTTIGESAFQLCTRLNNVTLPESLISIDINAFDECWFLQSVHIPKNVKSIGLGAFSWSGNHTKITVDPENPYFNDGNGSNCIIETATSTLIFGCHTTIIPDGVQKIGPLAFQWEGAVTFMSIPASVTSIAIWAFHGCKRLEKMICYATSVPTLDAKAFEYSSVSEATLYVPAESIEAYRNSAWNQFGTILPLEGTTEVAYDHALAAIEDGANYSIFTEIDGQKYYITADGHLSAQHNDAGTFTFQKVENKKYHFGFLLNSQNDTRFSNPYKTTVEWLTNGFLNSVTNNRPDWEAQVFFVNDEGKYAIRATNAPYNGETSGWEWVGNSYWAAHQGEDGPFAGYSFDMNYIWQLEKNTMVTFTCNLVENGAVTLSETQSRPIGLAPTAPESFGEKWHGLYDFQPDVEAIAATTTTVNFTPVWGGLFAFSDNLEKAKWHNMHIRSGWYVSKQETEPYTMTPAPTAEVLASPEFQWAFKAVEGEPFQVVIYNRAAEAGQSLSLSGENVVLRDGEFAWEIFANSDGFVMRPATGSGRDNKWVNQVGGAKAEYPLGIWDSTAGRTDDGSTFRVEPTDVQTLNVLTIDDAKGVKNGQMILPIALKNKHEITGLQFELYLPEGVTVATKTNGKMQISTTSRMNGSYTLTGNTIDNFVRVTGYSGDSEPFADNEGDILNVILDISNAVAEGEYPISLKNIILSDVNNTEYHCLDAEAVLTVKHFMLGDVDNTETVNINDVVCIINYILNKPNIIFIKDAADVDEGGSININDVVTLINRFILHRNEAPRRAPQVMTAQAAVTDHLYLDNLSIKPGETLEIAMKMANANEVRAVQGNVKLPAGLKFVTKDNGKPDVKNLNERSEDFTLSCALQEDGSLTFAHYSADGFTYAGHEGGIFTFKIIAEETATPGDYEVDLFGVVMSINGVGYEMPNRVSEVKIINNEDGIGSLTPSPSPVGEGSIYNLSGQRLQKPQRGVNIIDGKKVVVK